VGKGTIGIAVQEADAAAALAAIERYDAAGVAAAWLTTGGIGPDALTTFAAAATRTEKILLGTAITPLYPRHPLVVVQQVSVIASLAPGRFRLGVGPSHKPGVEAMFGIPFEAPLGHLREYLGILRAALYEGAVDVDGRFYHAHGRLPARPTAPVPIMASALRANAFRLCGEVADGAISWLCPLSYLRDVAVPALREGSARAGRDAPPLVAHVPICLSTNPEEVLDAASQQLANYPKLPYYAQMMVDSGLADAVKGEWSREMVETIVAHGDEQTVARRLQAFFDAGATEIIAAPVTVGERRRSLDQAAEFLSSTAKSAA
jgi:F420-dependent oxidoreductase-like protein